MNIPANTNDTILVMAPPDTMALIRNCIHKTPGLKILDAVSQKTFFQLIYTHACVLIVLDTAMPDIDLKQVCVMLNSHKKIHNAPLLLINRSNRANSVSCEKDLNQYPDLYIDSMEYPFAPWQLTSKLTFFYEFHHLKSALIQSRNELEQAFQKMIKQHDTAVQDQTRQKRSAVMSAMTFGQMQQPLKAIWGAIRRLQGETSLSSHSKTALSCLKNSAQQIERLSKQGALLPQKTAVRLPFSSDISQPYQILYAEPSNEDFNILNHLLKSLIPCQVIQTHSIRQSVSCIAGQTIHLILTTTQLEDGTGIQLLSRIRQLQPETPVMFMLNRALSHQGPEILLKGAFAYFIKEDISSDILFFTITGTHAKTSIIRAAQQARERLALFSRKDILTRLPLRNRFERIFESEMAKTKRYPYTISLIMIHFNSLKTIARMNGQEDSDQILSLAAGMIKGMIRECDTLCRYDTDLFSIILPHTEMEGATILAQRIKNKINALNLERTVPTATVDITIEIVCCDSTQHLDALSMVEQSLKALDLLEPTLSNQ